MGAIASELWPQPEPLPIGVAKVDPYAIQAPEGWTYQWVRSALMGEPDPMNVKMRLDNGWTFVEPEAHPGAPVYAADEAIGKGGLVLMKRPSVYVQAELKQQEVRDRVRASMQYAIDKEIGPDDKPIEPRVEIIETPSGKVRLVEFPELKMDSERFTYIGSGSDGAKQGEDDA